MSPEIKEKLYSLLPAIYRERDATLGEPLRALLRIIQGQADLLEDDIWRLWQNVFIETCDPWVVPYIGDLVANIPLFDAGRIRQPDTARTLFPDLRGPRLLPDVALRGRADVAKTIYYRRRKGTLPMLEELARDVSGWGAHAVEMFELLGWTQCVRNHLRMHSLRTPDIRRVEPMDRLNGPFDTISHTVDVRHISPLEGWYNIKNIGFFLWRLNSYELENVAARPAPGAPGFGYHFSPLGNPAPLFTRWRREGDEAGLAMELHVPGPIRCAAFYEDLKRNMSLPIPRPGFTDYYGLFDVAAGSTLPPAPGSSLMVFRNGVPVPPDDVITVDLATWTQPPGAVVGVDVHRGRLAFGAGFAPASAVDVFYHHGFSADMGGGPYRRRAWQVRRSLAELVVLVDQSGPPGSVTTLNGALLQWQAAGKPNTIIVIADNRNYAEPVSVEPADGRWLVIEADDGARPHIKLTGADRGMGARDRIAGASATDPQYARPGSRIDGGRASRDGPSEPDRRAGTRRRSPEYAAQGRDRLQHHGSASPSGPCKRPLGSGQHRRRCGGRGDPGAGARVVWPAGVARTRHGFWRVVCQSAADGERGDLRRNCAGGATPGGVCPV